MQKKRSKSPFTLLEVTIAIFILVLISSLTGFQLKKLIDSHTFEKQVSHLFSALQDAQVLSCTYQTDIALDFYHREGKLCYRFTTNEPFQPAQLNQHEQEMAGTKLQLNGKKIEQLHFDFYSGRLEPRGIMTFLKNEDKKLWFDLQYGQLIKFSHQQPSKR